MVKTSDCDSEDNSSILFYGPTIITESDEMVDMPVLETGAEMRESSNLSFPNIIFKIFKIFKIFS